MSKKRNMEKIDNTPEYDSSTLGFDVFNTLPYQTGVESIQTQLIRPLNSIQHETNIDFQIGHGETQFLHPDVILNLTCSITDNDGTSKLKDGASVTPENNTLDSLFEHLKIQINNQNLDLDSTDHKYKCMFEHLLSFNHTAKSVFLKVRGYDTDWEEKVARFKALKGRKIFSLTGRLSHPMLNISRFLPPGMNLTITLKPSKSAFVLRIDSKVVGTQPTAPQLVINDAYLIIKKVTPTAVQFNNYMSNLARNKTLRYQINRTQTRYINIVQGTKGLDIPGIVRGVIPRRLIFGLVDHLAMNGAYDKDPYKFEHFDLTGVNVLLNGHSVRPAYDLNFHLTEDYSSRCTRPYYDLIHSIGQINKTSIDITYENFLDGTTLFAYYFGTNHGYEHAAIEAPAHGEITV
jgi:hypothetical protein